jgi:hypothetical protein
MFVDVPPGVSSLARPGANPFVPAEIVSRLCDLAAALQRIPGDSRQAAE